MSENNNEDKFSQLIKNKLDNYSLPIEENSWNQLEKRLAEKPKKIRLWPWISGISVAASIALIWLIFPFNKHLIKFHETAEQLPRYEEAVTEDIFEREIASSVPTIQVKSNPVWKTEKTEVTEASVVSAFDVEKQEEKQSDDLAVAENPSENSTKEDKPIVKSNDLTALFEETDFALSHKKKKRSFGFYAGSGRGLLAMNTEFNSFEQSDPGLRSKAILRNASGLPQDGLFRPDDFSQIRHNPPLSFGLSVRKELNNYLSLESGLTYTYLYSKFENKFPLRDAKLELHYLGVPINLIANLYQNRSNWSVYTSVGGMAEKGLQSFYEQNEYRENEAVITVTSNERIKGLQYSLNASVGVDYKLIENYSVYFEPKVSYYLKNNQPLSTRTENPLVIGINAGVRYSW